MPFVDEPQVFCNCKMWAGAMRPQTIHPALEEPTSYGCFLAKQIIESEEGHTIFPEKIWENASIIRRAFTEHTTPHHPWGEF